MSSDVSRCEQRGEELWGRGAGTTAGTPVYLTVTDGCREEEQTEGRGRTAARQTDADGIMSLTGRAALVTGGAQGIGRAAARALLLSAAKVSVRAADWFLL